MKTHLGHYEIIAELGRGGMGVVYKGYEPSLARFVAIKELSATLANEPAVVERFLREARSMAMLNDPHIIQIYSIGQEDELPFFVMEFVDGLSVADLVLRDRHLQAGDAMKIVHQTAQGLSAAHDHGVIHRDIKPANLMISQRGQIKIADFGIALANHDMNAKLTSVGEMVGTPGYLPPEILLGNPVDQRSDLYALGVVLFEMLTGRTPFTDASVYKLMLSVVQEEVPDVRDINADIDPGVAAILAKMLMKLPANRYQSMHELNADLEKHPLVSRGGSIGVKLVPEQRTLETQLSLATPMTPGPRSRTPPAPARQRPTPSLPVSAGASATHVGGSRPGLSSAAPAAPVAKRSRKGWWIGAAAALLLVAVLGWQFREPLSVFAGANDQAENAAASTDSAPADADGRPSKQGGPGYGKRIARSLPSETELARGFQQFRDPLVRKLRSFLRITGIPLPAELLFNALLGITILLLVRGSFRWLRRSLRRRPPPPRAAPLRDGG